MKKTITLNELMPYNPCYSKEKIEQLLGKRKSLTAKQIWELAISNQDKIWVLTKRHFLSHTNQIKFAVLCAEQCIDIFEWEYPNDKRPRRAIEAAKLCAIDRSEKSRYAAAAAAADADADAARSAAAYAAAAAAWSARSAARSAAGSAAAADAAAYAAAYAADAAYAYAARSAESARKDQLKYLISLIYKSLP